MSPTGQLAISGGWIGQKIDSNWKMWPESDNDGYHLAVTHASLRAAVDATAAIDHDTSRDLAARAAARLESYAAEEAARAAAAIAESSADEASDGEEASDDGAEEDADSASSSV